MEKPRFRLALPRLLLAAAAMVAAAAPARASGEEPPEEKYLFRAFVPDGRLAALLPPKKAGEPSALVWTEGEAGRLRHYKAFVARLFTGSDAVRGQGLRAEDVVPGEIGAWVPVSCDAVGTALRAAGTFDGEGFAGEESFPAPSAGGVVVNAFSFRFDAPGAGLGGAPGPAVKFVLGRGGRDGALLPSRVVGQNVWLLDWDSLRKRWDALCAKKDAGSLARVRGEIAVIAANGRFNAPGGKKWEERMTGWRRESAHSALWPRVVFQNAGTDAVKVAFNGATRVVPAKGAWTNSFARLPGPGTLTYQVLPAGDRAEDLESASGRVSWTPDGTDDVLVSVKAGDLKLKPYPRLFVDTAIFPSGAVCDYVRTNSLDGFKTSPVSVKYADHERPTTLFYVVPENPVEPAFFEIEPHKRIEWFSVEEGAFWEKAEKILPDKEEYSRGETARSKTPVALKPWPAVRLETAAPDRPVTNEVSVVGGWTGDTVVLKPGESKVLKPEKWLREDEAKGGIEYTLKVVASADHAETTIHSVTVVRGAGTVTVERGAATVTVLRGAATVEVKPESVFDEIPPPPPPEVLPWPGTDAGKRVCFRLKTAIFREPPSFGGASDQTVRDRIHEKIAESRTTFDDIRTHLAMCKDESCTNCVPFKANAAAWGVPLPSGGEGEATDAQVFAALWAELLEANKIKSNWVPATWVQTPEGVLRLLAGSGGGDAGSRRGWKTK